MLAPVAAALSERSDEESEDEAERDDEDVFEESELSEPSGDGTLLKQLNWN